MTESERKKQLVELEGQFRRAATALAVAQADFEKAYAAMWGYTNEHSDEPQPVLSFSPDVVLH